MSQEDVVLSTYKLWMSFLMSRVYVHYPCEPKAALNIALDLYDVTEGGPHLLSVRGSQSLQSSFKVGGAKTA